MDAYQNEYERVIRYSGGNSSRVTESDFHKSIHENPEDDVNSLAYADWLEENGRPAHAKYIRESVGKGQRRGVHAFASEPWFFATSGLATPRKASTYWSQLELPSLHSLGGTIYFQNDRIPHNDASAYYHGLTSEGIRTSQFTARHFPVSKPRKRKPKS